MAEKAKTKDAANKPDTKTPQQRTDSVLVPRVNALLDAIRILGNCANPAAYVITAANNKKMFDKIRADMAHVEQAFADAAAGKTTKQVKQGFSL